MVNNLILKRFFKKKHQVNRNFANKLINTLLVLLNNRNIPMLNEGFYKNNKIITATY